MKPSLEQQTVLITGGSRGIGAAAVLAFAKAGYRVAFTWHSHPDAARQVVDTVRQTVPDAPCLAIMADAADSDAVQSAVEQTARVLGGPHVLVCNAGIAQQKLFTDLTDEDWRRMMSVDLDGVFYACRAVLPGMIHQKYGRILCISSMWGQTGGSCEVHYCAAKAGVIGLCRALAKEEGPSGITVNCVAPGVIDTAMNAVVEADVLDGLAEETPLGRIGTAREAAQAIVYLASEEASFITGQVLTVDGGFI